MKSLLLKGWKFARNKNLHHWAWCGKLSRISIIHYYASCQNYDEVCLQSCPSEKIANYTLVERARTWLAHKRKRAKSLRDQDLLLSHFVNKTFVTRKKALIQSGAWNLCSKKGQTACIYAFKNETNGFDELFMQKKFVILHEQSHSFCMGWTTTIAREGARRIIKKSLIL